MDTIHNKKEQPLPHLYVTDNIAEAVKSVSPEEWKKFFQSLKANKIEAVEACADSDLTRERGKLTMVSELQGIFMSIHSHRKPNQ